MKSSYRTRIRVLRLCSVFDPLLALETSAKRKTDEPTSGLEPLICSLRVRCSMVEGTTPRRRASLFMLSTVSLCGGSSSVREA